MHRRYSKFLIASFVAIVMFGVYSYFYNHLQSEASDSPITSSLGGGATNTQGITTNTNSDTAFINNLTSLNTLQIDTTLFNDKGFSLLVDNNISLAPVPYGRPNPFAPTDKTATSGSKNSYTIKTSDASSVKTTSAILNGSLEGATSSNIYFEYGTTNSLGKTTTKVIPSLVGNFAYNLTSLTPKTTYFFRAAASVGGTIVYGDIMSFSTN